MSMASAGQGGPSLLGVVQSWYSGLPLCTKGTFSLIVGIFVVQLFTGWYGPQAHAVSLVPHAVLYDYQVYRLLSSALIHGGLLHVTFNMLAFVPMATSLERAVGTLQLLYFLLMSCLLGAALYVALSVLLAASGLVPDALYTGAMGFSGVIFGLVVWETALSASSQRNIFGLFQVPAAWYPWALLIFCQLLVPQASFLGHLAGLLVGQLWVWGYLRPLALSRSATVWLEQSFPLARCVRLPSFILSPSSALPYTTYDTARGIGGGGGGSGLGGSGGSRLGWFGGRLGQLLRSGGGEAGGGGGGGSDGAAGGDLEAAGGGAGQGRGTFAGKGRTLGAGGGAASSAPAQPPSVAAALAAEARMGGGGGGGSGAAAPATSGGSTAGGGAGGGAGGNGGAGQGGAGRTGASRDKPLKS
ncbi:hypothetical protein PLESTB_000823200 [Pleodorina starrii]|uniref:Peptidase S54 rhomboid domain-containing protein n=1 Tax=Pleodorina starrii TaxID=330485 RepID=A0A9W6BLP6_9CHLO|nr:hypothetical protein PLESTM_000138700 [Pleodorina starrii]GLC54095.1 hypothetical protein PLESTB_000823200 [Pleodorina starrii]GLC64600.1 hypothetical protein PLESTF_000183200 [Pleodorina starrii]